MKNLKVTLAAMIFALFFVLSTNDAQAQQNANVGQALSGLVNVNIGNIQVDIDDAIDVSNVLTDFEINILNNALNNNEIASRNSDFLNDVLDLEIGQVVVGILNGQILVLGLDDL